MKTFTDTAGRPWSVSLTIGSAKRVRGLLDVNLLELEAGDPPLLTRLGTDVMLLCDVIFALVKPEADAAAVTDEQFGAALGGDVILQAQAALYDELVLFFQGLGRTDLAKAVESQRRMIDLAVKQVTTAIGKIGTAAEASMVSDIEAAVQQTVGRLSTNSPDSAASTPGP